MRPVVFDFLTNSCNIIKKTVAIMQQYFITLLKISFHQSGES
ncbi:hypothetical protein ACA351_11445 [Orientia tsutsugamushi]|uniref:Uncharacterized protein n=1 Tax=Orientia tsutsugamushi TaxID=784 RepID=A0A2U3QT11_ORITS|nr:hypothetical protein [Orientia tsutsugamushi]KJV53715.1 hypothetical protein OTSKARP_1202 [Orientia tsutsugamushi str. Karp]KJV83739.1 hypothetical protein OTSUT76_1824 [Orientia tsutsugamushi str. UT76]SPR04098.1 Uncharacterised protein [Orientia tsutsugamushi]SPR14488.1 Uncharacterised protein [Orientia tsutsugamushi]